MKDIEIVQYTGVPTRRYTARIPPAMWDSRKSQIIALYHEYTLDDVVEKMKEAGFTANRRQYIHQLERWGIAKYDVKCGKDPGSDDTSPSKRKHFPAGAENGDVHRDPSSSQATPSHKRPKVAENDIIRSDDDGTEEEKAPDNECEAEREDFALTETKSTKASDNSQPHLQSCPLPSFSPTTTFTALREFLRRSRPIWYAGQSNLEIAHQVSLFATNIRSRPQETTGERNVSPDNKKYLQDIGEYLWGARRGEGTFDIYALVCESDKLSSYMDVDMILVMPCVRSADSRKACQWVASFLEECKVALENVSDNWDALILSYLMLARKLFAHGLHVSAKRLARDAYRLEETAFTSERDKYYANCLHSIQDLYFPEVERTYGLEIAISTLGSRLLSKKRVPWNYAQLRKDMKYIRSELISLGNIIMEYGLEAVVEKEKEKNTDRVPSFSAIIFQLIGQIRFQSLQQRLWSKSKVGSSSSYGGSLPDFVGTCCDLLAHLAIQHSKVASTRIGHFYEVDLVDILSSMDEAQLYMDFVRAYCCRDWRCSFGELTEPPRRDYRNISPNMLYSLAKKLGNGIQTVPLNSYRSKDKHAAVLPSLANPLRQQPSKPSQTESHPGNAAVVVGDDSSSDKSVLMSPQEFLALHCSADNYNLDPTLASCCGSSLASYEDMIEARAAMAKSLNRVGQDTLAKGSGRSLPSIAMRLDDEMSISMKSLSIHDT